MTSVRGPRVSIFSEIGGALLSAVRYSAAFWVAISVLRRTD
jgi:hypothetical protein